MRRRRARTCSMRSAGRRLVPSDGGGATRNSRALAFHAGGPREWHAHVCPGRATRAVPTSRSAARELSASPRRMLGAGGTRNRRKPPIKMVQLLAARPGSGVEHSKIQNSESRIEAQNCQNGSKYRIQNPEGRTPLGLGNTKGRVEYYIQNPDEGRRIQREEMTKGRIQEAHDYKIQLYSSSHHHSVLNLNPSRLCSHQVT